MKTNLIWYDLETTGLEADVHGVVQIAFLFEKDGELVDKYVSKINCDTYSRDVGINQTALDINGNTVEQILTYPSVTTVLDEIQVLLRKHYGTHKAKLVGFNNTSFDKYFLTELYNTAGRKADDFYHFKQLDIFEAVKWLQYTGLIKSTFNQRLVTLLEEFGLASVEEIQAHAHDALWDVHQTRELSLYLANQIKG